MNILKLLRNPKLIISSAIFMLFFSCSQYEIRNRSFDYALYESYKNSPVFEKIINKVTSSKFQLKSKSTIELKKEVLRVVNEEVGSDLEFTDEMYELIDYNGEEVLNIAHSKGWISTEDKILINSFNDDYNQQNFNVAIENFEKTTLSMNLSDEEFQKKNSFVNVMKLVEAETTNSSKQLLSKSGSWDCFFAIVGWLISIVGLLACATIILCGFALAGYLIAVRNMWKQCGIL